MGSVWHNGGLALCHRRLVVSLQRHDVAIFEKYPRVVFGIHVDDLSYSTESDDPLEVVESLAVVHEEMQKGLEEKVEMQVAHNKTIVLASNQAFADKIAQCIGVPNGVTVCKKLGVDYTLFGGDVPNPVPAANKNATRKRIRHIKLLIKK